MFRRIPLHLVIEISVALLVVSMGVGAITGSHNIRDFPGKELIFHASEIVFAVSATCGLISLGYAWLTSPTDSGD